MINLEKNNKNNKRIKNYNQKKKKNFKLKLNVLTKIFLFIILT